MLTVNCAGHLADVGCASLIWFNPCGLIGCKVDELCHNGVNGPCCLYRNLHSVMTAWLSSNGVAHVNKVTLHRVWLVLGWVTLSGSIPSEGHLSRYVPATRVNSAWPSLCGWAQ